jgi:hypothetical protein
MNISSNEGCWTPEIQFAIDALQDRKEGATVTAKLAQYFMWNTRNRKPDAYDRKNAKEMLAAGFDADAIGCGLELFPQRVDEALLT